MKNLFKNISLEKIKEVLVQTFKRFPLSFVSSLLVFSILEFLVFQENLILKTTENILLKLIFSLSVVYFLSIWLYLLAEKFEFKRKKTCFLQSLTVLFWISFYFSFEENLFNNFFTEELIYIIITFIWTISFIFISSFVKSFLKKDFENDKYYTFFNEISSKILMTLIVWWALTILGFIALGTTFALFDLGDYIDESRFFGYWAVFSLSLFAPVYFLAQAPEKDTDLNLFEKIKNNKFYNFLNNYITLPFIIIYFFILYAYTIKVLLNFDSWPEWIISWMVILFSLFGYLIYIFSYGFEQKLTLVRVFRKYFPFAVLLQTPMLFYAIYLRINQYDFTINRYLVVIFWIFLVLISIHFIFSKKKYLLALPALLTLFIVTISIWPWGVYSFPEARQLKLLEQDLVEAKIIQDSKLVIPLKESDIEAKLSGDIYEKVSYLCAYHGCDSMEDYFSEIIKQIKETDKKTWETNHLENIEKYTEAIKDYEQTDEVRTEINEDNLEREQKNVYTWISSWTFKEELIKKLKVKRYSANSNNNKYINFRIDYNLRTNFVEIKDYDYIFDINTASRVASIGNKDLYSAEMNTDIEKLIIYKSWEVFEEFSLVWDFEEIYEQNKNNITNFSTVNLKENFELEKIWEKLNIKIILSEFRVVNKDYIWVNASVNDIRDNIYNYVAWKILLKEK